jgi:hypothetical protein
MDCSPIQTYGCWSPELSLDHFAGGLKQLKWYLEAKRFANHRAGLFELQNQLAQITVVDNGSSLGDRKPPNFSQLCLHQ